MAFPSPHVHHASIRSCIGLDLVRVLPSPARSLIWPVTEHVHPVRTLSRWRAFVGLKQVRYVERFHHWSLSRCRRNVYREQRPGDKITAFVEAASLECNESYSDRQCEDSSGNHYRTPELALALMLVHTPNSKAIYDPPTIKCQTLDIRSRWASRRVPRSRRIGANWLDG